MQNNRLTSPTQQPKTEVPRYGWVGKFSFGSGLNQDTSLTIKPRQLNRNNLHTNLTLWRLEVFNSSPTLLSPHWKSSTTTTSSPFDDDDHHCRLGTSIDPLLPSHLLVFLFLFVDWILLWTGIFSTYLKEWSRAHEHWCVISSSLTPSSTRGQWYFEIGARRSFYPPT